MCMVIRFRDVECVCLGFVCPVVPRSSPADRSSKMPYISYRTDHGVHSGEWEPPISDGLSMAAYHVLEALAVVELLRARSRADKPIPVALVQSTEARQAVSFIPSWRSASRLGNTIPWHETLLQGRSQESLQSRLGTVYA